MELDPLIASLNFEEEEPKPSDHERIPAPKRPP